MFPVSPSLWTLSPRAPLPMGVVSSHWHSVHMRSGLPGPRSGCRCSRTHTHIHTPSQCALCEDVCVCDQASDGAIAWALPKAILRGFEPATPKRTCPGGFPCHPHTWCSSQWEGVQRAGGDWMGAGQEIVDTGGGGGYPPVSEHLWQSRAAVGVLRFLLGFEGYPGGLALTSGGLEHPSVSHMACLLPARHQS